MLTDAYSVFLRLSFWAFRGDDLRRKISCNMLQSPNKQHWPHVLKSVRDPFDCRASRCTNLSSQIWGWFKSSKPHYTIYFEGMNIHSPAILLGSPWDLMGFDPQPSGCVMLFMFGYPAKNCHWYPPTNSQHLLGRMVGAEDLNPTAKWLLNRPSLEAIQYWSGRTWPIFAPDVPISSQGLLVSMIGFETNSHGAHHLPSTSNRIQLSNYNYWWANLQHVSILNCLQPWDCSTDGGARWVKGSRQVIPVGQRLVC